MPDGPTFPGAFLLCDGCREPTPMAPDRAQVRSLAANHGWLVDVGPASEDFCPDCRPGIETSDTHV